EARLDDPAQRRHADAALAGEALVEDEASEAARAIAALFDFSAVGIEDPVAEVDTGQRLRRLHKQDLVGADTEVSVGQAPPLPCRQLHALPDTVDDDEIVARAVHL